MCFRGLRWPSIAILSAAVVWGLPDAAVAGPREQFDRLDEQFDAQREAGEFRRAEQIALQMRRLVEQSLDADPELTAYALTCHGIAFDDQERFQEAEPLYRRALEIRLARTGEEDLDAALSLSNLGLLYQAMNRFAEAESLQKRALAVRERLGGRLSQLPYTAWESSWVRDVFGKRGIETLLLEGDRATEANVRSQLAGRRIVHLACHGLADQSYGNFYGALAFTPERQRSDPADDGCLTLAEIYELDLQGCELAILSACQTNFGPQQRGEGVWALSRGFLVAGARRVVASNWPVDDEAAASLVSYFCGSLARREAAGKPLDYAAALQQAKRAIRGQEKWKNPYYWGTLVLVGPD